MRIYKELGSYEGKSGKFTVYITACDRAGQRYRHHSGVRVLPRYWDKKSESVSEDHPLADKLNHQIELVQREVHQAKIECMEDKVYPSAPQIKKRLKKEMEVGKSSFMAIFAKFVKEALNGSRSASTKRLRKVVNDILVAYEKKYGPISFEDVGSEFLSRLVEGLFDSSFSTKPLSNTTVRSYIGVIHYFMCRTYREGVHDNRFNIKSEFLKRYKVSTKTRPVLLDEEVERLAAFEIEDLQMREVRDAYIFQARTGIRISEVMELRWEHIKDEKGVKYLSGLQNFKSHKTSQDFILTPLAAKAIEGRPTNTGKVFDLPGMPTYNKCIKAVAESCGLDRLHVTSYSQGASMVTAKGPLYQFIDSHSARHTFAVWFYKKTHNLKWLQNVLGHSMASTTENYLKALENPSLEQQLQILA